MTSAPAFYTGGASSCETHFFGLKRSMLGFLAVNDPVNQLLGSTVSNTSIARTMEQIAARLRMGSRKSSAPKLHAWRKANE